MKGRNSVLFLMSLFFVTRFRNAIFKSALIPLELNLNQMLVSKGVLRRHFGSRKSFNLITKGLCRKKDGSTAKYGKCGEDSFVISQGSMNTIIAVADGVGGWGDHGGDSSQVSNGFMKALKHFHQEQSGSIEKLPQLLEKCFKYLISTGKMRMGTTTICAASINHENGFLEVSNIGDSQLVVIRDGKVVLEVEAGVWAFNSPNQIGFGLYGEPQGDIDEMSIERSLELLKGDVIVVGTDGLFDNIFVEDIAGHVEKALSLEDKNEEEKMSYLVKRLVKDSYEKGLDDDYFSPFAKEAIDAGKAPSNYSGGKPDDISIIVARVI